MSKNWRTLLITPLNGLTLSTLFFYPLLTAVSGDNINFLHWALIDSAEAISSWLFVGSVFTALIYSGERIFSKKINTVWTLLLIEFGAFMALGGLIRNEPLYSLLQTNRQSLISFTLITSALNLALIAWIYLKKTNQPQEIISNLLLLASPLNLIFIFIFITLLFNPKHNNRINNYPVVTVNDRNKIEPKTKTLILLFDELSPNYLYGSKKINLDAYPTLKDLVINSNKFMNAHLQGEGTSSAIPNLMTNENENLSLKIFFENEKIKSSVMGWALNYCRDIVSKNENCSSTSIFNARTLNNDFSIIDQIWTNLNLLPYQKPFGFIKIPAATEMHRRTLEKTTKWLLRQVKNKETELIYAHFNIPHVPYLSDTDLNFADSKRFDTNEKSYLNELTYVDQTLKKIFTALTISANREEINLIILSDHNSRVLTKKDDHEHIVLMYKDFTDTAINEKILNEKTDAPNFIIGTLKKIFKSKD